MPQYADRYVITDIDGREDVREVSFANGEVLKVKEARGFKEEKDLRRVQIRETIVSHFDKEEELLYKRRIKCLSLFFIDEVAKYKQYDESGAELKGEYAKIFEEEYTAELNRRLTLEDNEYQRYLRDHCSDVPKVHNGYFSIDKKNRIVNSETKRGSEESDDISAYDLILKIKKDCYPLKNLQDSFSPTLALREGWDNPNVFQICTLKQSDSKISKVNKLGVDLEFVETGFMI